MTIILRTVCGCEKEVRLRDRDYPPYHKVAYCLTDSTHAVFDPDASMDIMGTATYTYRLFRRTPMRGTYGYPVYLEVLGSK